MSNSNQQEENKVHKLYSTPQEFLEQVSLHVDTQSSIYQYVDSHLYPTSNPDDEYVVIVLQIMDPTMRAFFGGNYLVQQWTKKRKLFQTVHNAKPNRFFLYKQRFIFSLFGTSEEAQWLYIVNFYQEIFNKIRHPTFNKDTVDGGHELSLYVDAKIIIVATFDKLMWAPFKFEETQEFNVITSNPTPRSEEEHKEVLLESSANYQSRGQAGSTVIEVKQSENIRAVLLESNFKSVFANMEGDLPEFLQILDVNFEGFSQKEINVVVECETKIVVYKLNPVKLRKFIIFKMVEKYKFDKIRVGFGFRELVHSVRMIQIGESESIYLLTKGQGQLVLLTEKDIEQQLSQATLGLTRIKNMTLKEVNIDGETQQVLQPQQQEYDEDPDLDDGKDSTIKLKSFFIRRNKIYLEEVSGTLRCLNSAHCKVQKPLKKCLRLTESKEQLQLSEISMHLGFYSDYLIASTAIVLAHGKILSIFDFKTSKWSHIFPEQQGNTRQIENQQSFDDKQCYFGQPDDEITTLVVNNIFQNSIYDCLVLYKGKYLRRLKYFNEVQKTCFEKAIIFKGDKVKQIVKNYDYITYRQYGDSQARTFFMVQSSKTKKHDIWISENGSKMTKLIRNIEHQWIILNLSNAPSDLLAIYMPQQKTLNIYSIHHVRQCLDPSELTQFLKYSIENWNHKDDDYSLNSNNYFLFNNKLFYCQDGNLIIWNFLKKGKQMKELNFKSAIKEFFMTQEDSVYYKDKNNVFRYANLKIQKDFDIGKLPTKVQDCQGAFVQKLDYCLMTNRFAFFTSPFQVTITPNLNNYSIDLMSTLNFESNFVFWKQTENRLHAFKQPNMIVTWDLDTGKVIENREYGIFLKGFKKHSDWDGATLLKQVRDQAFNPDSLDEYPPQSSDYEEEKKLRQQFPDRQLFSLVEIDAEGSVKETCRFLYNLKIGQQIFVSYPYAVVMENDCARMFVLEQKYKDPKLRAMKAINTFYEPQMKVGKPIYFSPNLQYRIYIDPDNKQLTISYTLTSTTIITLDIRKQLMFQKSKHNPMIYFHDNDHIVYLTQQGIEKKFYIEKTQKRKKTIYSLKEIANIYYSEKEIVRRILFDQFNFKKELGSQIKHIHMLQIRTNILKRALLLNEYLLDTQEEEKESLKSEYQDKNIGDFNYFIVDSYRRELNFSYLAWKIIEQIQKKKLSILNLKREFVSQLVFTILPYNETILHYLNENFDELQNFLKIINDVDPVGIGQASKSSVDVDIELNDIPFLPNIYGKTPLHISIEKNNTRFTDRMVQVLADTDFDHHSRFIIHQLQELIEQVPQALNYYLENRQKCPNWIKDYTRGKIEPLPDCDFMMATNQLWYEDLDATLNTKIFNEEAIEQPLSMSILDLPDLHKYDNKLAKKFMEVLSETDNLDLYSSTSTRAIVELKWPLAKKAMVKYLLYPYLALLFFFVYYACYVFEGLQEAKIANESFEKAVVEGATDIGAQAITSLYSDYNANFTYGILNLAKGHGDDEEKPIDDQQPDNSTQDNIAMQKLKQLEESSRKLKELIFRNQKYIIKILILGLCLYFFILNFRQFVIQGPGKYFKGPWNYIDLIPLSLITFSMLLEYFFDFPTTERAINSVSVFFIWLKSLYFLRMFRSSSKFISMIVSVISDMKIFLAVFVVSLVTFSQSMYIISNNQTNEEDKFITSFFDSMLFTYRIALGDWDIGELGNTDFFIIISLFILSTLFLCVVMLNLLIAIISDTYANVEGTSQNQLYKNLADLINENQYLIPSAFIKEHDDGGSYLYIAKIDTHVGTLDKIDQKIKDLRRTTIFRTAILDRVSQEFAKQMALALENASERYNTLYLDEGVKNEIKFKMVMKRIDKKKDDGSNTPQLGRGVSTEESPDRFKKAIAQITRKSRRSARPASRQKISAIKEEEADESNQAQQ